MDIIACENHQKTYVSEGTSVFIRTGFITNWKRENERFLTRHAGVNLGAAKYLVERGAVAVGADTSTFEVRPLPRHDVRIYLLVAQGVPI